MSSQPSTINADLYRYAVAQNTDEHPLLTQLRQETLALPAGKMISSVEQVQFIQLLIKLMSAERIIEIGTFTGYTSLAMAMAVPDDGKVLTCDINPQTTQIAQRYWHQADVVQRIELQLSPAIDLLDKLISQHVPSFDLAYIDADKKNNRHYYEKLLELICPGGVIIIDNVLWKAKVIDEACCDSQTESIRDFNQFVAQDSRVENFTLMLGDGITLARKV